MLRDSWVLVALDGAEGTGKADPGPRPGGSEIPGILEKAWRQRRRAVGVCCLGRDLGMWGIEARDGFQRDPSGVVAGGSW